ncbi:TolC family protein [Burkholderia diffusa]|uniref:TolC family protein n=1 Tax=Burkholderia diffusa TaxID=488732 RepID=UPI002AB12AAC|nr:TolC family protein [Burkholderia diffusa]
MPPTLQCADAALRSGVFSDLPFRRTTLSLLFATGMMAVSHSSSAALIESAGGADPVAGDESKHAEPSEKVVTISLSDDRESAENLTGSIRAEREQRLEARKAMRTARALRIASMLQAERAARANGQVASTGAGSRAAPPPRSAKGSAGGRAWTDVSQRGVHADVSTGFVMSGLSTRSDAPSAAGTATGALREIPRPALPDERAAGRSAAIRPDIGALPPDLAGASASSVQPGWDAVTRQAAVRMRARTLTAHPSEPESLLRNGGASLASAANGRVTLAEMINAERRERVYPAAFDPRLNLVGSAAMPGTRSQAELARDWMAAPVDGDVRDRLPPQSDLRPIFLAAVEAAFDRSPQIQLANASYRAQMADVDEVKGRRWPQLQFSSRSRSVEFGGSTRNSAGHGTAITANVTTSIFDWGYLSKSIKSRQKTADAGKEYYDGQLENSAYTVTTAMAELAKQRLLITVSQQFVDRMQQLVTMLAQIVAVDRGRASELTQAKARLLQAQASRDAVAAKARDTELTLRKLVGERPLNLPLASAWNIVPAPLELLLSDMDKHPQIRQARAEAQAAQLQAEAVRVSSRPSINWIVSKTIGRDEIDRTQPFQTMLTLNWNAFQGGSAKAAEIAALERARASEQKIEQARLDLGYAIRAADEDARTLLNRASLYGNLVGETDSVRKAFFDQWYHLGKRTLLDVLQAESDHYGNRVNEITTRFDGYQAVFRELSSAGELIRWLKGTV